MLPHPDCTQFSLEVTSGICVILAIDGVPSPVPEHTDHLLKLAFGLQEEDTNKEEIFYHRDIILSDITLKIPFTEEDDR